MQVSTTNIYFQAIRYCASGRGALGYRASGRGALGYRASGRGALGYRASGRGALGYRASGRGALGYRASGRGALGYRASGRGALGYRASGRGALGYRASGCGALGYRASGRGALGYRASGRGALGYRASGRGALGYRKQICKSFLCRKNIFSSNSRKFSSVKETRYTVCFRAHRKVPIFCKTMIVQRKCCVPFPCPCPFYIFPCYFCCVGKIILHSWNGEKTPVKRMLYVHKAGARKLLISKELPISKNRDGV